MKVGDLCYLRYLCEVVLQIFLIELKCCPFNLELEWRLLHAYFSQYFSCSGKLTLSVNMGENCPHCLWQLISEKVFEVYMWQFWVFRKVYSLYICRWIQFYRKITFVLKIRRFATRFSLNGNIHKFDFWK